MAVKQAVEALKYTDRTIKSYRGMQEGTIQLYQAMNYESDTLRQMIDYTNERIEATQSHHDYWLGLINKLEDERFRNILLMRYVEGKTTEVVSEALFYTNTHVIRLTPQAIRELAKLHQTA